MVQQFTESALLRIMKYVLIAVSIALVASASYMIWSVRSHSVINTVIDIPQADLVRRSQPETVSFGIESGQPLVDGLSVSYAFKEAIVRCGYYECKGNEYFFILGDHGKVRSSGSSQGGYSYEADLIEVRYDEAALLCSHDIICLRLIAEERKEVYKII